jgi:Family of unknown function (DUF6356)
MKNIFTEHPHSIGESYLQHFFFAFKFGAQMAAGGLACILHAVFPFIFQKTASNYLLAMTDDFVCRMPAMEDRVIKLAHSIERKRCESQSCQNKPSSSDRMNYDTQSTDN